jgi:serine-type D-Ala-D-Ala carboxypeptidase/endopeptidase (penicillin-binding protein 4)
MKNVLTYFFPFILLSCSASYKIKKAAQKDVLKNKVFISAHTGISVYNPTTGKYLYNYQGDKYFVPASNTKLWMCYASMKYLGDSITGIKYKEADDTLFVIPVGDPTFLGVEFTNQPVYNFLKNTNKIIVLNTSLWHENRWGNGWSWNDYNDDYAAERSVMPVYENLATFSNDSKGIQVSPPYFSNKIMHETPGNKKDFHTSIQRDISSNTFFVSGNDSLKRPVQIPFYTASDSILINILKDTLHKAIYSSHADFNNWKELYSQPTDSLLKITMHRSDNFFAEQSLLMVSTKLLGIMNDEKIIDTLLKTDYKDLPQKPHWVDGSGLSHYNLFSPEDFVTLLNKMKNDFGMERIKNILPTGGTGTLSNYYKKESGFIFAKTGSLSGIIALSGFLYTKKNKLLIFSFLINNYRGNTNPRKDIEKFIEDVRNKN